MIASCYLSIKRVHIPNAPPSTASIALLRRPEIEPLELRIFSMQQGAMTKEQYILENSAKSSKMNDQRIKLINVKNENPS